MGRVKDKKPNLINDEIKFEELRIVGDNVETSIYPLKDALRISEELELDLVLINPNSTPPVCKIMNYEKYLYELKKNKKPHKSLPIKEVKFGPNISDNDFNTKLGQIIKFLNKGHKVKTYVQFRGREMAFQDNGKRILLEIAQKIQEQGVPEALPDKVINRRMFMTIKPK
jgi:translation initiation factor IF-3